VTESQFADDLALYATNRTGLEIITQNFVEKTKQCGLKVNVAKTKGMVLGQSLTARDKVSKITVEEGGDRDLLPWSSSD